MSDFDYVDTVLSLSRSNIEVSEEQHEKVLAIFKAKEEQIAQLQSQLKQAEIAWINMGGLPFKFNTNKGGN